MFDLLYHRASEVDLSPAGDIARVRLVIDGVMIEHEPLELISAEVLKVDWLHVLPGRVHRTRRFWFVCHRHATCEMSFLKSEVMPILWKRSCLKPMMNSRTCLRA